MILFVVCSCVLRFVLLHPPVQRIATKICLELMRRWKFLKTITFQTKVNASVMK